MRDVENFVAQEVDAIVVLPLCGVEPLTPVLEEAPAPGSRSSATRPRCPAATRAIVYQNVAGAQALADEAIRWYNEDFTGDKENFAWALFTYDQCGTPCTDRTDPIREAIVEATGVEPIEAESVDETSGLEATETFLQQEPELAMVIGINDAGALGAYQAMQAAIANGRDPESIFVAGMDGQIEALELIAEGGGENGIYRASGALILDDLGRAVADLPADILEGEEVEVLELPYEIITTADPERAQEIVDTYTSSPAARMPARQAGRAVTPAAPAHCATIDHHVAITRSTVHRADAVDAARARAERSAASGSTPSRWRRRITAWLLRQGIVVALVDRDAVLLVAVRQVRDDVQPRARPRAGGGRRRSSPHRSACSCSAATSTSPSDRRPGWPPCSWACTSTSRAATPWVGVLVASASAPPSVSSRAGWRRS